MLIINDAPVREFAKKHPAARAKLITWTVVVNAAKWADDTQVKNTYNSADYVPNEGYVFNVGNDRILALVNFTASTVAIKWVKTHAEYDKWKASKRKSKRK